jgi:glycosyltransferase involved in cell wall biosynthesis
VDQRILEAARVATEERKPWVVYSGTFFKDKGLKQLVTAWRILKLKGWELHLAGQGELATTLQKMAEGDSSIVFHGLLDRAANARLLSLARIGINPHDLSLTPGNVFAFKIIEYLAAGAHCITTPMGALEESLEAGLTYMPDNRPETIATTLRLVVETQEYQRLAATAAQNTYGPEAVARNLDQLLATLRN